MPTSQRVVLPLSRVQPVIGRAFAVRADAEQRAEGVERIEPAVKAERELVEVGLQVLRLDTPVMCALQPRFQVAENQVDDGQVFFCHGRVVRLDRRKRYAVIEDEVCSSVEWTSGCSGCSNDLEGRGFGCHECGYHDVVRQSQWVPDSLCEIAE